ncbi:MAG: four helix bundle protein [Cytophagales bacterium]
MHSYSFEKLNVWKDSLELVKLIYKVTKGFPSDEKYGLISQMKRSSVSVSSNIAEGSTRKTDKNQSHFYSMAYGSLIELLNQLIISEQLHFISKNELDSLRLEIDKEANKLNALQKSRIR